MRVLVAGGAGYIGTVLVKELLDKGHSVDVIDLLWFGNCLPTNVKVIHKNINELSITEIEVYDSVIYLGGLSNDPMANYDPYMNFVENVSVPIYLVYLAKEAGIKRFVFASSCSVYGYTKNKTMDE